MEGAFMAMATVTRDILLVVKETAMENMSKLMDKSSKDITFRVSMKANRILNKSNLNNH